MHLPLVRSRSRLARIGDLSVIALFALLGWYLGAPPHQGDFFLNAWLPARLLWRGQFSYHPADALVNSLLAEQGYPGVTRYVGRLPGYHMIYPPWIYGLVSPLGLMSYRAAITVWAAVGGSVIAAGIRIARNRLGGLLLALIFWPIYVHLTYGQYSLLVLGCLIVVWWDLRQMEAPQCGALAGMALAVGTVKPQLIWLPALTATALWLWHRRWRELAGVVGGGALLYGLPLLIAPRWLFDWLGIAVLGKERQSTLLMDVAPSIWGLGRLAGWPDLVSGLIVLGIVSAFAVLAWRLRTGAVENVFALAVIVGLLATPYLLGYDLVLLLLPAWVLLAMAKAHHPSTARALRIASLMSWAAIVPLISFGIKLPLHRETPDILVILGLLGLWLLFGRRDGRVARPHLMRSCESRMRSDTTIMLRPTNTTRGSRRCFHHRARQAR